METPSSKNKKDDRNQEIVLVIIEDEGYEIKIEEVKKKLEDKGIRFSIAKAYREGLDLLKKTSPMLVIVDAELDNQKKGYELIQEYREGNPNSYPEFVLVTDKDGRFFVKAKEIGVDFTFKSKNPTRTVEYICEKLKYIKKNLMPKLEALQYSCLYKHNKCFIHKKDNIIPARDKIVGTLMVREDIIALVRKKPEDFLAWNEYIQRYCIDNRTPKIPVDNLTENLLDEIVEYLKKLTQKPFNILTYEDYIVGRRVFGPFWEVQFACAGILETFSPEQKKKINSLVNQADYKIIKKELSSIRWKQLFNFPSFLERKTLTNETQHFYSSLKKLVEENKSELQCRHTLWGSRIISLYREGIEDIRDEVWEYIPYSELI